MNNSNSFAVQKQRSKIEILQIMRTFSAIVVFLSHFFDPNEYALPMGTVFVGRTGVAFFFMISGFLLIYTDRGTTKGYFRKRIIRLVPLYYITTLAVFGIGLIIPSFLHTSESGAVSLIKSLLFIPFYSGKGVFPLYPITWTLTAEVFVYVIYYIPLLLLKIPALRNKSNDFEKKFKCIFTSGILAFLVILREFVPKNIFTDAYGAKYMLYFIIGILCACFWDKILDAAKNLHIVLTPTDNKAAKLIAALSVGVCIIGISLLYKDNYIFIAFMGVIFMIMLALLWEYRFSKAFVVMGDISYSFYLIHYFVVKLYLRMFCNSNEVTNVALAVFMAVLCYAITTVLAYICFHIIEKRFSGWLKKVIL